RTLGNTTESTFELEYRALAADGRVLWLRDFVRVTRDAFGAPVTARGVVVDVTDRVLARDRLRRTNDLLGTLVNASPLAIVSLDADRSVRTWNAAAEELFGWSAAELAGRPLPAVLVGEECGAMLARGANVRDVEAEWIARGGRRIPVSVSIARLHGANGVM